MATFSEEPPANEFLHFERRGPFVVITLPPAVDKLDEFTIQLESRRVSRRLKKEPPFGVIIDLGSIRLLRSVLITLCLDCYIQVKTHGGKVALVGVSEWNRDLLRTMLLDPFWTYYSTCSEAMDALLKPP